jgi:N-acetylneuraminic acid mutarotase
MDEIKSKTQRITSSLTNTMTAVGIVGGIGTAGFDKYFSEIEVTEGSRIHETDMTKNHR